MTAATRAYPGFLKIHDSVFTKYLVALVLSIQAPFLFARVLSPCVCTVSDLRLRLEWRVLVHLPYLT